MSDQLADHQLEAFDTEYVNDARWQIVAPRVATQFAARPFHVIDVGGGNGSFADRLLHEFPSAQVTVLEPASVLLDRNRPHERKTLVAGPVSRLRDVGPADLITMNWVLHHMVGRSYRACGVKASAAVVLARQALRGTASRVSVFEIDYDGWPIASAPGRLTFAATRSRLLRGVTSKLGANTAGTGVCFRSHEQWRSTFEASGFVVEAATETAARSPRILERSALARRFLMLSSLRTAHYWLSPSDAD